MTPTVVAPDRPTTTARTRAEIEAEAVAHARSLVGTTRVAHRVRAFLDCPDHPGAGLWADECEDLAELGDPNEVHDVVSTGAMLVEVTGHDAAWDGDVLHVRWFVRILTAGELRCGGRPVDATCLVTPWLEPPPHHVG